MEKEVKELTKLIFKLSKVLQENFKGRNKKDKISFGSVRVLFLIKNLKNPTMNEIADLLGITPPSATSMVAYFIKKGLLKRVADNSDRRLIRIVITKEGDKILNKGFKKINKRMEKILSFLSKGDVVALRNILENLTKKYNHSFPLK